MKFIFLMLFPTLITWAQDAPPIEEVDTYLEAIKDIDVQDKLKDSPQFTACKTQIDALQADPTTALSSEEMGREFETCMEGQFQNVDDAAIEELAENLELKAYNKKASQSAASIREYLSKRLRTALYGVDDLEKAKLKDRNLVSHDIYYQLYAEQIGKNTLLEVSKYCLETFYVGEKTNILKVNTIDRKIQSIDVISAIKKVSTDPNADFEFKVKNLPLDSQDPEAMSKSSYSVAADPGASNSLTVAKFFKTQKDNFKEAQVCSLNSSSKCDNNGGNYKPVELLLKLKDAEYKIASEDGKVDPKEILRSNYELCAGSLIRNMCELYKCKNVYNTLASDKQKGFCKDDLGIPITRDVQDPIPTSTEKDGVIACSVMKRLSEYRNVLSATQQLIKDNEEMVGSGPETGFQATNFKGVYQNTGENKVDRLTSITSKELTENVDSFKNAESFSEELKEKCFKDPEDLSQGLNEELMESDDDCRLLANKIDKEKFDNIQINQISITQVQKEELNNLEASEEALIAFLQRNGMDEYLTRTPDGGLKGKFAELAGNWEELKKAIDQELEAEKETVIANIQQRFLKETTINEANSDEASTQTAKTGVAEKALAEIEQHQKRVQATLEYSNLVSSYLTVQDAEGNEVGENSTGRQMELEDQDTEALLQYFTATEDSSSAGGSGGNNINYLDAIDRVIGVTEMSEEQLALQQEDDS